MCTNISQYHAPLQKQRTSDAHKPLRMVVRSGWPFLAFLCALSSPSLSTLALELLCQCMESTSQLLTRAALNQKAVAGRGVSLHEGHRHQRDAIFIHAEHTSVTNRRILPVSDWDMPYSQNSMDELKQK